MSLSPGMQNFRSGYQESGAPRLVSWSTDWLDACRRQGLLKDVIEKSTRGAQIPVRRR